jgi:hypothetical protein
MSSWGFPARRKYRSTVKKCTENSTIVGESLPVSGHFDFDGLCVSCDVGNGLPTANGKARGYYVSRGDGRPMLVVERRSGDRIRINAMTEVVVLEIHPDRVMVAVKTPGNITTSSG